MALKVGGLALPMVLVFALGCNRDHVQYNPDAGTGDVDGVDADGDTADTLEFVCCPINPNQTFCGREVLAGGWTIPGGTCDTWVDDGGGPRNGWVIRYDEYGCAYWTIDGPVTEFCLDPEAGVFDVGEGDARDSGDSQGGDASDVETQDDAGPADARSDEMDANPDTSAPADTNDGSGDADLRDPTEAGEE